MAPATENAVQVLAETKSNYKVIAFALDLTGKKLIDEICHITACDGSVSQFDQYIMTYRDISRSSVRIHGIRIFTMLGKYRVLKDMNTLKSLHTKSEYSTLNDFIQWLIERKENSEGVILAYHDIGMDRVTPFLMEALERYHLADEFFKVVKGFVNCCNIASSRPELKGKSLAIRSLARRLLGEDIKADKGVITDSENEETKGKPEELEKVIENPEQQIVNEGRRGKSRKTGKKEEIENKSNKLSDAEYSARNRLRAKEREKSMLMQSSQFRALTTYKLLQKFAPPPSEPTIFEDELLKHLSNRDQEVKTLEKQRELATKVRSLRPIFLGKIRRGPKERSRAVLLRRHLIEAALDYPTLRQAYEDGSTDAITKLVEETSAKFKKQHLDELVELIVQHFNGSNKKDINANEVPPTACDSGAGGDQPNNAHDDDGSSTGTDSGDDSEAEFQEANGDNDN